MVSSAQIVSGELSILQSNVVRCFHNLDKNIQNYRIMPHVLQKYGKTFGSALQ